MEKLSASTSAEIKASPAQVWKALTDPALIKKYFFNTDAISEWKVGKPLIFKGEWEGKAYEDKGTILEMEPEKLFKYTYWSSFSGTADEPANYANITYQLNATEKGTKLTITQDGLESDERCKQCEQNWNMILNNMKELLEK